MRQESVEKDNGAVSGRFVPSLTQGADIGGSSDSGDLFDSVDATDGAKELAEEEGVDLAEVEGTGKEGRIIKSDVEGVLS